jgi:septation ring formation regulator EzrA
MINKTEKQSESIFDSTQKLDSLARKLSRLAYSFSDVGNETVAGKLLDIAYSITEESELISKMDKDNRNQRLQESQETVGKLFNLTAKLCNL